MDDVEDQPRKKLRSPFGGKERIEVDRRTFLKTGATMAAAAVAVTGVKTKPGQVAQPATPDDKELLLTGNAVLVTLNVNGKDYYVEVEPRDMLVNVLREQIGLTGTKRPCNRMECGGCTVLIDDKPYYSCTYVAMRAQGKKILTVEGSGTEPVLGALQEAWYENDASQCGYCQEGQLMSATGLLKSNPNPTMDEIKLAMSGNLCRCGTYMNIITAIQSASKKLGGG